MLHNDTPKFTIPTSTSFSKSLRLHFEPEEDEPRGRRIVDSRTRRSRKIGDASVFFFFSLHAGKVNAYFWSGWLSRHPRILRHQHDKVRSRYLAHAAHLATYTRVRSRARHSFFSFLFERWVTQPARERRWDFECLESGAWNSGKFEFFKSVRVTFENYCRTFRLFRKLFRKIRCDKFCQKLVSTSFCSKRFWILR